ncbi:MAG: LysM peptidoglycan-binding domain-containing protein [Myxococcota bacterium]
MSWAWVLACLAMAASSAAAGPKVHVIEAEQTLASLARDYYADTRFAGAIAAANGLGKAAPEPGRALLIPTAVEIEVSRGESWSSLARDHWGSAELGPDLASFLGYDTGVAPPRRTLLIPTVISHRVRRGETLESLSRTFYLTPNRARALAQLNRIHDPRRLLAGATVRIPFARLARHDPEARDVSAPPPPEPGLRRAVNAYLDGRFEQALGLLEELRTPVLAGGSDAEREQLFKHLVFAYVAFERNDEACGAYRALRSVKSGARLDPDLTSPKILRAVAACQ